MKKTHQQKWFTPLLVSLLFLSGCFGGESTTSKDRWDWEGELDASEQKQVDMPMVSSKNTSEIKKVHLQTEEKKEAEDIASELNNMWGPDPFAQKNNEEETTDVMKNEESSLSPEEEQGFLDPSLEQKNEELVPQERRTASFSSDVEMLNILRELAEAKTESEKKRSFHVHLKKFQKHLHISIFYSNSNRWCHPLFMIS
ncbi:hypothetical protein IPN35_02225 [Candidatus Peregrinibacteria bacterium]|nr:MAG: hypothetical protein IPN35_02225 [Candidatus Peregrinibacteria bacterium]